MKSLSIYPRAVREDKEVAEKFRLRTEKALEKHRVEQEILATKRARHITVHEAGSYTGALGMYIIDTEEEKTLKEISQQPATKLEKRFMVGVKDNMMVTMIRFFKGMYGDTDFELTWRQFMAICLCLQLTLPYIIRTVYLIVKWGALPVITLYLIISVCISMPMYMLLMFFANYSKRCYIRFWECVPALKGLGYSVGLLAIQHELHNMFLAAISFDYIIDVVTSEQYPWKNCNFVGRHPECSSRRQPDYNRNCCLKHDPECDYDRWGATVFKYPPYDYLVSHQLGMKYRKETDSKSGLPLTYFMYVGLLWLGVFIWLMVGLKRFRKVLPTINIVVIIILFCPIVVFTLVYGDQEIYPTLQPNYTNILTLEFLTEITRHTVHRELAGDIVTYSALSSPGISSGVHTVCIYIIKSLSLFLVTVWVSMGASMVKRQYRFQNPHCIDLGGYTVMFAVLPDLMTRLWFPKILILCHYLMIFIWSYCGTVYTMFSMIGSLMDEYPTLGKYKGLVCGSICALTVACNFLIMYIKPSVLYTHWLSESYTMAKVFLVFFTILGIFTYNLNRLCNDYHFTYGKKISVFWIHGIKIAALVVSILTLLSLFEIVYGGRMSFSDCVVMLFILFPAIAGATIVFIRYKSGLRTTFMNPDPEWGPANHAKRVSRARFDPKRALRYKSTFGNCKHSCLLRSRLLDKEICHWNNECYEEYNVKLD